MSFLTPLYLLAGLAVLAPILAHLVRKKPREVIDFSSVIFLESSSPKLTNRNRLDQWMLLALRTLILLALALAFARPYLKTTSEQPSSNQPAIERILLIDTSASMRRNGVWEDAMRKAKEFLGRMGPDDTIGIYAMTDRIEPILSLEQSRNTVAAQRGSDAIDSLSKIAPTWRPSDHGKAMAQALDLLNDQELDQTKLQRSQIAVASDFQQGSSLESLGLKSWPSETQFTPLMCQPKSLGNASLSILHQDPDQTANQGESIERIAVRNSARSKHDRFTLHWLNTKGQPIEHAPIEVFVPAGQQQIIPLQRPKDDSVDSEGPLVLELRGDDHPFDNRQYLYRGRKEYGKALCIDSQAQEPKDSISYFVSRIPLSQPGLDIEWEVSDPSVEYTPEGLKPVRWVIASSQIQANLAEKLKESIEQGMHLFWVFDRPLGGQSGSTATATDASLGVQASQSPTELIQPEDLERTWRTWFPKDSVTVREAPIRRYQLLQQIDMTHPVFATFADPKFNDFTKVRFWKHRHIDGLDTDSWRILARFDDGDPALLERSLGKGAITIMAAGWQPIESQLALSSKFVPMIGSMFEQGNPIKASPDYFSGDAIPERLGKQVTETLLQDRTFESTMVDSDRFEVPGIYRVQQDSDYVVVNIPRNEGLTDPIDLEEFSRFGIQLDQLNEQELKRQRESHVHQLAEQLESNQRGWWWILLSVLLIAGLESLFSIYRSRVQSTTASPLG